jgi:hypothetical protein
VRKWLEREEWSEPFDRLFASHLEAPCKAAGIDTEELPDILGDGRASNLFNCIFEDMLASQLEDGRNIVDDYLKRRGWKELVPNKRYMMALRSSVMSLYEVSDIVRDQSFLARDLLRGGEPVRVSEKLATREMRPWDVVGLRLVKMGPRIEMSGGALPLTRKVGKTLRGNFARARERMRTQLQGGGENRDAEIGPHTLDTEALRHGAFLFSRLWLEEALEEMLDPTPNTLINSDGETVEPVAVRYPLKPDADRKALADGLASIPGLRSAAGDRWDMVGPPAIVPPGNESGGAEPLVTLDPDGAASLASVELEGCVLTLEANSPRRAERMRALLDPVIGRFVGEAVVTAVPIDEILASRSDIEERPPPVLSAEEERAFVHETLKRHFRGLLDRPEPALGDTSPREAAKTTEGRERLADWLKGQENVNAQHKPGSPVASYDMSWLWEELGVSDLRR